MLLIQHENNTQKNTTQNKYKTHVQIEVELSSPDFSMTEKVPNQQYVEIFPISFQNDDPANAQLDITGKNYSCITTHIPITLCCIHNFRRKLINSI